MSSTDEVKLADLSLRNWGRYCRSDIWLSRNLLIDPPPTSKGYIAPIVSFDDPEPARMPVDIFQGALAEHVIVSIGCEPCGIDSYRLLVRYYTRLIFMQCTQADRFKRLAKFLHCSNVSAPVMLQTAQLRYWQDKKVMDGLLKLSYRWIKFDTCVNR